jgi:hypothetical protein
MEKNFTRAFSGEAEDWDSWKGAFIAAMSVQDFDKPISVPNWRQTFDALNDGDAKNAKKLINKKLYSWL